ncbi:MAG: ATP-dependent helicase HrpB [Moraxellaceae bacterium]|nr:MAG: ATP-dependent helicase HrpB [Moraxellaceae bacterium]
MLPVQDIYPALVETLKNHDMALLQAPPGAGKSTWLPLQLIRDGHFKHIVMLEPRRLAARNIARYLAKCQNEKVGQSIGLRIRQEKLVSKHTKLEIVTEGMLTRMLQNDPELSGIDCIIFDEFHERSIAADTALAFALETQAALRDDLKILLMSATLDAERIQATFDCPVLTSDGRSFPIDEYYHVVRDESRWLDAIPAVIKQAMADQPGSCLVFLPGQREIKTVAQKLTGLAADIAVFTLYGEQDKTTQQDAIAPAEKGQRKIVLSTNVAETSLTIEGIRIVVDSGRKRAAKFNLKTGVTELRTVNISKASAIQRAGRAGRIEPGVVYRLGTIQSFERREAHDIPEILSSDISQLLLEAKQWGADLDELDLLDKPTATQKKPAFALLLMLEAVDSNHKLTMLGKQLLNFGTDIRWAHMLIKAQLLESDYPGIVVLSVYLLALLESRVSNQADLALAIHSQYQRPHPLFKKQLGFWLKRLKLTASAEPDVSYLPILLALAYPDRIAKRRGKGYLLANGAGADSREDYWHNDEFIAIAEMGGQKGARIFSATPVSMGLLEQALPHLFSQQEVCEFDEKSGRFLHENRLMLGAITVSAKTNGNAIDASLRTSAWITLVQKKGLSLFNCFTNSAGNNDKGDGDKNEVAQLLVRMMLAHQFYPKQYPEINEAHLLVTAETWLGPFLNEIRNLEQLKKFNFIESLRNVFSWQAQQELNSLLPLRIKVPSGSNIRVVYQLNGPAKLSMRMQEVFGLAATPLLGNGKLPLLMDLLSPGKRSLQLTQDLAGFWQSGYREVQKEMKGRYPKHFWPDDPANAQATNRVKSRM